MQVTVAIIGGGLSGLYAAKLLHAAGIDFRLMEARERFGGRILTANYAQSVSEEGFDVGPSWFWPEMQPQMATLVRELNLATFPQHNDGDVVFERMSRETAWRYRATHQEPQSMRFVGGSGSLIDALVKELPRQSLLVGTFVKQAVLGPTNVTLNLETSEWTGNTVVAEQMIACIPPRLLARISFSPDINSDTVKHWRETPTWMAPHAKFFAIYDRPFWRDAGLSGTAQSLVGPLAEIHDASTASGEAALLGFLGTGADMRASLGEAALIKSCLEQLARLFGPEALRPRATIMKDWAADPLTATPEDQSSSGHPDSSTTPWVTGAWQERLSLGGSETSATEPGYMAGAVSAATRAVEEVTRRLRSNRK
jgi:monoamine oxidase